MPESQVFLIACVLGISSSAFLSGFAFSASYLALPALSLSPIQLRLRQWQVIYDLGKLVSPTVAAASTAVWGWITWTARSSTDKKFYAIAGLSTFAILPWTAIAMMNVNRELMKRAKIEKEDSDTEGESFRRSSEKLLARWNEMNYVRVVMPMMGAWVGLYAALGA